MPSDEDFEIETRLAVYNMGSDEESFSIKEALTETGRLVHKANKRWWHTPNGIPWGRNFGEMIALCHSELSEALEGHRKDRMDDHLPQYKSEHVELVDTVIRIFDMLGADGVNIGEILYEKMRYNAKREDHKLKNRILDGGKKY